MLQNTQDQYFEIKRYAVANPSPGTNFTFTPIVGRRTQILSVEMTLASDANAANRLIVLQISDGTNSYHRCSSVVEQPASKTWIYHFSVGVTDQDHTTNITLAQTQLPEEWFLNEGETLQSNVISKQIADQISSVGIRVKEWDLLFPEVLR